MKTAIKLALIYLAMQILGALAVGPFTMIYAYVKYGTVDRASEFALAPTLLAGFVFMLIYLWQKGYLTGDKRLYSPVSVSYLSWSAMMGISMIYLIDFLMSHLTFIAIRLVRDYLCSYIGTHFGGATVSWSNH